MYKLITKQNNIRTAVTAKLSGMTTVSLEKINIVYSMGEYRIALPKSYTQKKLFYEIPFTTSLTSFLLSGINEYIFDLVISEIIRIIEKMHSYGLSPEDLVLNTDNIFVGPTGQNFIFLYLPLNNSGEVFSPFEFFYDFLNKATPCPGDSGEYLNSFNDFLRRQRIFLPEAFNYYLGKKSESKNKEKRQQNSYNEQSYEGEMRNDKMLSRSGTTDSFDSILPDYAYREETPVLNSFDEDETTVLNFFDEDETTVLGDFGYTTVLEDNIPVFPTMKRIYTGEEFKINKSIFMLGKDSHKVDFKISNNGAISRLHATISSYNSKYYIKDNNSTNKTYLNGEELKPNVEVEIKDGDEIILADEKFEFHF